MGKACYALTFRTWCREDGGLRVSEHVSLHTRGPSWGLLTFVVGTSHVECVVSAAPVSGVCPTHQKPLLVTSTLVLGTPVGKVDPAFFTFSTHCSEDGGSWASDFASLRIRSPILRPLCGTRG